MDARSSNVWPRRRDGGWGRECRRQNGNSGGVGVGTEASFSSAPGCATTMVVLPDGEEILDVICGDRDFWVVSGAQNVAHVKPREGWRRPTSTSSRRGTIYSFLLNEKTPQRSRPEGVRVNADATAPTGDRNAPAPPRWTALQAEVTRSTRGGDPCSRREGPRDDRRPPGVPRGCSSPTTLYEVTSVPFLVRAIWNDGQFTSPTDA